METELAENTQLTQEDIAKAITLASRQGMANCAGYVELADLTQVCWLDLLEKPRKYQRYQDRGDFTGLVKEMVRTSGTYAQRQKAESVGYKVSDLFFYNRATLRNLIPLVLNSWETGDKFEFEATDRAAWLDVEVALQQLSQSDYQIICWCFHNETGYSNVACRLSITEDAARQRVDRVLDKLREFLGGSDPNYRRRAVSNAASQAQTRNAWDGEG